MNGIFDTLTDWARSAGDSVSDAYHSGVNATNDELLSLQSKAQALRGAAADMMMKRAALQDMDSTARKHPALYDAYRAHLARGVQLQGAISNVLGKVDTILGAARAAGMRLSAVPIIAGAAIVAVMGTIGAIYYAISSYNKQTDASLAELQALQGSGGSPEQLTRAIEALNKSGTPATDNKRIYYIGAAILLGGLLVWRLRR